MQPQTGRPVTTHCSARQRRRGIDTRSTGSGTTTPERFFLNTVSTDRARAEPRIASRVLCVAAREEEGGGVARALFPRREDSLPLCTDSPEVSGEACRGGRSESSRVVVVYLFIYFNRAKRTHVLFSTLAPIIGHPHPPCVVLLLGGLVHGALLQSAFGPFSKASAGSFFPPFWGGGRI